LTWVKICANTNLRDALAAAEAGADALGFVFVTSPRRITPSQAAEITSRLPHNVEKIGVIADESLASVREIVGSARLTGVQLHGHETPEYVRGLRAAAPDLKIIKGLHPSESADEYEVDGVLLDSGTGVTRGGTGKAFDWQANVARVRAIRQPVIIAGGLTPENVRDAITIFRPFGVDVATGVEFSKGVKDLNKLVAFIAAARQ
jgi:phosphoribosylanthranilate isomerase